MESTNDFKFSINAQNVGFKFYNKKAIVYVEGDDDLNFWQQYFSASDFELINVHGCNNIEKKINEIKYSGLKCIAACDSDYKSFDKKYKDHSLVIRTLSHSIECVMYCPHNINKCIMKLARTLKDKTQDIEESFKQFGIDTKELIAYDIANNLYGVGERIAGDSCCRFLKTKTSYQIDRSKIISYLEEKKSMFNQDDIKKILESIDIDKRDMRQITKGHFQTSFVTNLIKSFVKDISEKNISLSEDNLYALLVNCTLGCGKECNEVSIIKHRIDNALKFLNVS